MLLGFCFSETLNGVVPQMVQCIPEFGSVHAQIMLQEEPCSKFGGDFLKEMVEVAAEAEYKQMFCEAMLK